MFDSKVTTHVIIMVWFGQLDMGSGQLTAESKSTHCSYIFNVPRDENTGFCPNNNNTSENDEGMESL